MIKREYQSPMLRVINTEHTSKTMLQIGSKKENFEGSLTSGGANGNNVDGDEINDFDPVEPEYGSTNRARTIWQ